ncbi:MAG: DUF3048 domain-containing protein [Clostridia bacterium]|nr:DUF3048 domain-containing protein [Clostridia bacterium]
MKTKILIVILAIVVIALGVLLGMKFLQKEEVKTADGNVSNEGDPLTVVLDDKKKDEGPKSKYSGNERTIGIIIDNVGDAVPQTSLNEAMIVYEAYVEGGLTRFLAIYKNAGKIDTIGPTRSARPVFVDYVLENDSLFVHYGGSSRALGDVQKLGIDNLNGIESPANVYWRTKEKKAPHNALTNTERIWAYVDKVGYRKTTNERNVLNYVTDSIELEEGTIANVVNIPYSTSKVKFTYNEETKLYERSVGNKVSKDWLTGETLIAKNIIITFAENYTTDEDNGYGRQEIKNIGNLDGYYITNGKAIKIKCYKEKRNSRTLYKDLEGNEIKVNDGNTYIQIVPPTMNITME